MVPDNTSKRNIVLNYLFNGCLLFLYYGQLAYFFSNVKNVEDASSCCSLISTSSQTIFKFWRIVYSKSKIHQILVTIWKDFWPSSLLTNQIEYSKKSVLHLFLINFFACLFAIITITFLFSIPLFSRDLKLPYQTLYPFKLDQVPFFEIMFSFQWFLTMLMVCAVFGFDVLFGGIVINVIIQLQIIRDLLRDLNSLRNKDFYFRYKLIGLEKSDDFENEVLLKCVAHHNTLLRVCKILEEIYSPIIFLNFAGTIIALCVSSIMMVNIKYY